MLKGRKMIIYTRLNDFIDRLDGVRSAGHERYRAKCPVHNGNNKTALLINYNRAGEVWAYCHNCNASTYDVANALGIKPDPEEKTNRPHYPRGCDMELDRYLIEIYEADKDPSYKDYKAYRQAKNRFTNFNNDMQKWMNDSI